MPADLELRDVSKRFGDVVALDSVSLEIQRGEFVTLLGPSGCGKTTTLRIVAGLEHETSGSVSIRGQQVNRIPPYRRNVNTVFQNYALFPHMSVFENVAFGLRVKGRPRAGIGRAVGQALEQVRLSGYERLHRLSGALQQGLRDGAAEAGVPVDVQGVGPLFGVMMMVSRPRSYRDVAQGVSAERHAAWWQAMLDRGILFHPEQLQSWYVSGAHGEAEIQETIAMARESFAIARQTQPALRS